MHSIACDSTHRNPPLQLQLYTVKVLELYSLTLLSRTSLVTELYRVSVSLCLPGYWTCLWPLTWSQSRMWSTSSSTWAGTLRVETSPGNTSEKSGTSSTLGEGLWVGEQLHVDDVKLSNTNRLSHCLSAQLRRSVVHEFKADRWSHRVPEHWERTPRGKNTNMHPRYWSPAGTLGEDVQVNNQLFHRWTRWSLGWINRTWD